MKRKPKKEPEALGVFAMISYCRYISASNWHRWGTYGL